MHTSDPIPKTGGERPPKRLSKFDPLRTSRGGTVRNPETVQFCTFSAWDFPSGSKGETPVFVIYLAGAVRLCANLLVMRIDRHTFCCVVTLACCLCAVESV